MIKNILSFVLVIVSLGLFAQTTLPNMDFEDWQQSTSFMPYWICLPATTWATGNPAATITGTYPTYRTEDAQSGNYAACLETKSIFGNVASGNLFTGWFEPNMLNSVAHFGVPFTGKPDAFQGWYKYTSVSYSGTPDECAIYAILSRWNGSQRVEIARAELYSSQTITQYTYFNLPFVYVSALEPDTISVVFASSRYGDTFQGGIGSKLFIDNINLYYDLSPVQAINIGEQKIVISYDNIRSSINIYRNTAADGKMELYDLTGKKIKSWLLQGNTSELPVPGLTTGIYICRYSIGNEKPRVQKIYVN